jgi:hypothetical protein
MAENEEPELSTQLIAMISNAQLGRLIAEFRRHPLAEGEVREVEGMTGVYVSLSKSQPESFCLSSGGRMYFFFRMAPDNSINPLAQGRAGFGRAARSRPKRRRGPDRGRQSRSDRGRCETIERTLHTIKRTCIKCDERDTLRGC